MDRAGTRSGVARQADQGADRRLASEDRRDATRGCAPNRARRRSTGNPTRARKLIRRRRSTANRVLTILKAALNHAHREGRCASDDAWRTVRAFREADAARLRYLSDDEARRLTNACPRGFPRAGDGRAADRLPLWRAGRNDRATTSTPMPARCGCAPARAASRAMSC